jgi:hypothetical protein
VKILGFVCALFVSNTIAMSISPSGKEMNFEFTTSYVSRLAGRDLRSPKKVEQEMQWHISHFLGLFESPQLVKSYGLSYSKVGGIGTMILPVETTALEISSGDSETVIQYHARGRFLVHKTVAQSWLQYGRFNIPMLYDLPKVYDNYDRLAAHCTDPEAPGAEDFWYFNNLFAKGCEALTRSPLARVVTISVAPAVNPSYEERLLSYTVPLHKLRASNGNGSKFSIYIAQGVSETHKDPEDEGVVLFEEIGKNFQQHFHFTKTEDVNLGSVRYRTFTGQTGGMDVEVRQLLADLESEEAFAHFWRDAVANGDVVIYSGHAEAGESISVQKFRKMFSDETQRFRFPKGKQQLYFLDACSSAAFFLNPYRKEKRISEVDILSNGLSSYFVDAAQTTEMLLRYVLYSKENPRWIEVLTAMENELVPKGKTYLINVGAL